MKNFCVPGDNTNHSFSLDSDPEMQKKDKTQQELETKKKKKKALAAQKGVRSSYLEIRHPGGASEQLIFDRAECDPSWAHIVLVLTKIMENKARSFFQKHD